MNPVADEPMYQIKFHNKNLKTYKRYWQVTNIHTYDELNMNT